MRRLFIALIVLVLVGFFAFSAKPAHADSFGWMCRTWYNDPQPGWRTTHCTQNWHWANGQQVSDNPAWVPNGNYAPSGGGLAYAQTHASAPAPAFVPTGGVSSNHYPFGQCTYGAAALSHDNVDWLGDAAYWADNAARRGMAVGYTPAVGATAVFAPGYHTSTWGTSSGHVAHVDAVLGNRILITEMNNSYYGGWGHYDTVWVDIIYGDVKFIY